MPYSIETKDGITINNIPDHIEHDANMLRERVSEERIKRVEREIQRGRGQRAPQLGEQTGTGFIDQSELLAKEMPIHDARGVGQSFLQGATLGFSDEIESFIAAARAAPFISDKTFLELRREAVNALRADQAQFAEENPATVLGAELIGGAAMGGGGLIKSGAKAIAKRGAVLGGIAGVGFSDAGEQELTELNFGSKLTETLGDALVGASGGAALSALPPSVIKAFVSAPKTISRVVPESILKSVIKFGKDITPDDQKAVIQTALASNIFPSVRGLEKTANLLASQDAQIKNIFNEATIKGITVRKDFLIERIETVLRNTTREMSSGSDILKVTQDVEKILSLFKSKKFPSKLSPSAINLLQDQFFSELSSHYKKAFGVVRSSSIDVLGNLPRIKSLHQQGRILEILESEFKSTIDLGANLGSKPNSRTFSGAGAGALFGTLAEMLPGVTTQLGGAGAIAGGAAALAASPLKRAKMAFWLENLRKTAEIKNRVEIELPSGAAGAIAVLAGNMEDTIKSLILNEE